MGFDVRLAGYSYLVFWGRPFGVVLILVYAGYLLITIASELVVYAAACNQQT